MDIFADDRTLTVRALRPSARTARLMALSLFVIAVWGLQHPYPQLVGDAKIYTLLALARLHPQSLSHDVFLRFGSQSHYTVFGPIYAAAIRLFDLGPGAAILTLLGEAAFYVSAYLLARRYLPSSTALLSVAFIAALPTGYGSLGIFHATEDFVTPRLPAEALTLAGLAAILASRRALGLICFVGAFLLHPIMALAGVVLLASLYGGIRYPKAALVTSAAAVAISMLLLEWVARGPFARIDPQWLQAIRKTSPFLFLSTWSLRDWSITSLPMAVLACGSLTNSQERIRRLCGALLLVCAAGLLLTALYCDVMHSVLATEVQPWRWLWLGTVIAVGFAPAILKDCWRRGIAMKAVPCLLVGALMVRGQIGCIALSLAAVVGAATLDGIRTPRTARLIFSGAAAALFVVATDHFANLWLAYSNAFARHFTALLALRLLHDFARDGLPYAVVLAIIWRLSASIRRTRGAAALLIVSAAAVVGFSQSPEARSWTTYTYTTALRPKFAAWRREIPPGSEVDWSDQPIGDWYLLARPSYISGAQTAGDIFSRRKSMVLARRERRIYASIGHATPMSHQLMWNLAFNGFLASRAASARELETLCADPALEFVVSHVRIARTTAPPVTPHADHPHVKLYLYRCSDGHRPIHLNRPHE